METQSQKIERELDELGHQEYMSDAQVEVFKKQLVSERESLLAQSKEVLDDSKESGRPHMPDPVDVGARESQEALNGASDRRRTERLKKIGKTLTVIGLGDYGYCQKCGEEIGLKRLTVTPTALYDVECASLLEITDKQYAHSVY
jgi:DnaK suppressor protein